MNFPRIDKSVVFPVPGSAADENVLAREDVVFEVVRERAVKGSSPNQILDLEVAGVELTNRERHAARDCTAESPRRRGCRRAVASREWASIRRCRHQDAGRCS